MADVEQRCNLSVVGCFCKAMYLRIAREILETTMPRAARETATQIHHLDAMSWGSRSFKLFMLSETFCQRADGLDFVFSRCHHSEEEVMELLTVCSSSSIGVSTGGRALLCKRASTWNDLACDAWTIVAVSLCAKLMAADLKNLTGLQLLHASLKPPAPSRLRSWPCRRSFAQLKELWKTLDARGRRDLAELRAESYWYVQACDVSVVALSLVNLQRSAVRVPVTEALLKQFRSTSKLLSQLEHERDRTSLTEEFCARPDALDVLYGKAVWHAPQREAILRAAFKCDWNDAMCGQEPFPLVATKGTLYSDVERVTATLLLDRMLNASKLLSLAKEDTKRYQQEEAQRKQRAHKERKEKRRRARILSDGTQAALLAPQKALLSHSERYLVHKLLATAPSWDISSLRVRWTFLELWQPESEEPSVSLCWDW